MTRRRDPRAMGQLTADRPDHQTDASGPTIVGGQPPKRRTQPNRVSAGVERVLYVAATDSAFFDDLLRDRAGAVERLGISLSPSELAMLRLTPEDQLRAAVSNLDVSPANLKRRRFMQAVAVGAAAAVAGCGDDDVKTDAPPPGWDSAGMTDAPPPSWDSAGMTDLGPPQPDAGVDLPEGLPDMTGIRPGDGGRSGGGR